MYRSGIEILSLEEIDRREKEYEEKKQRIRQFESGVKRVDDYVNGNEGLEYGFEDDFEAYEFLCNMYKTFEENPSELEYISDDTSLPVYGHLYVQHLCDLSLTAHPSVDELSSLTLEILIALINAGAEGSVLVNFEAVSITASYASSVSRESLMERLYDLAEDTNQEYLDIIVDDLSISILEAMELDTSRVEDYCRFARYIAENAFYVTTIKNVYASIKKNTTLNFVNPKAHGELLSLFSERLLTKDSIKDTQYVNTN